MMYQPKAKDQGHDALYQHRRRPFALGFGNSTVSRFLIGAEMQSDTGVQFRVVGHSAATYPPAYCRS